MTDEKKSAEPKAPGGHAGNLTPKITRRRFTKAGAVAPIVMTLSSRPVWGGQPCSFSGQLSGNEYDTAAPLGAGDPPTVWVDKENPLLVINGYEVNDNDKINDVIQHFLPNSPCTFFDNTGSNQSFKQVLPLGNNSLAAQAAAAVLNSIKGSYGYGLDGVMSFLCSTAVAHENEALFILQVLNSQTRKC